MTYTIDEAAKLLDLSYSATYRYVKDFNLGGDRRRRELTPADLEFIREQRYMMRKRRSKRFREWEEIQDLKARVAEIELILEGKNV